MYVTLAQAKQHLNIESTYTAEDSYITSLIAVAEDTVERHICYNLADYTDANGNLPPSLFHAILLYIGELYQNREVNVYGAAPQTVPFAYDYLLSMHRNYGDITDDAILNEIIHHLTIDGEGNAVIDPDYYTFCQCMSGPKGKAYRRLMAQLLDSATIDENGNITIGE